MPDSKDSSKRADSRSASERFNSSKPIVERVGRANNIEPYAFTLDELKPLYLTPPNLANPEAPPASYAPVHELVNGAAKTILVTGGAGFVGSHVVDRLMLAGHKVICVDNFYTGSRRNVAHWLDHPNFTLIDHDVAEPLKLESVDQIYHMACPASPPHYQRSPITTFKTAVMGTHNMLELAKAQGARMLLTSTSEVYGDPEQHPQKETYWGNVNPIGPRACYDEGKRAGETLVYAYQREHKMDIRVARIFNTFGPRMNPADGRVVSNFIMQNLRNEPVTIYGDGSNTRSFQYVHDLVDGLLALMNSNYTQPVNLGNPEEYSILEFADVIRATVAADSGAAPPKIVFLPASVDDPTQRMPDGSRGKQELGWVPQFGVKQGIIETVSYFRNMLPLAGVTPVKGQTIDME